MIKIKFLLCICFCLPVSLAASAQATGFKGNLYIVRHAEKDTGANPALSIAGQRRAGDLFRALKDKEIDLILVSQYRRTGMTADSLRLYNHIEMLEYKADATGESVFRLIEANAGKARNILIVGHSNTVPMLISKAGVDNYIVKGLPDHEYDNLFVIQPYNEKKLVLAKKYGAKSVLQGPATQMKISQ